MDSDKMTSDKRKAPESDGVGSINDSSVTEQQQPVKRARMDEVTNPLSTEEMKELLPGGEGEDKDQEGGSLSALVNDGSTRLEQEDMEISLPLENGEGRREQSESNGQLMEEDKEKGAKTGDINGDVAVASQESKRSVLTSSPINDSDKFPNPPSEVNISVSAFDPETRNMVYHKPCIKSDYMKLEAFLNMHQLSLTQSSIDSGYAADNDSEDLFPVPSQVLAARKDRWTSSTLGSSIPRTSIKTVITEPPTSPERLRTEIGEKKRGKHEPKLTSTRIDEYIRSPKKEKLGVSNGESTSNLIQTPKKVKKKRSSTSSSASANPMMSGMPKKKVSIGTGTPREEDRPKTPKPRTISREFVGVLETEKGGLRASVEPSPARPVAIIEGTMAKPLSQFEIDINKDPVVTSELDKSLTLWGAIAPNNPVFARWSDKNYYSGIIKAKGLNDTWIIDFDDATFYPASEGHILPIKILGVGIKGVYCPDNEYKPAEAIILGQKFVVDKEVGETVKYAIKLTNGGNEGQILWCTRRMLSLKEADARNLRLEFQPSTRLLKAAEVSLENIIPENQGRRRMTPINLPKLSVSTPSAPPSRSRSTSQNRSASSTKEKKEKKIVGGVFDASTADEMDPTPKRKIPPKNQLKPKKSKLDMGSSPSPFSSTSKSGRETSSSLNTSIDYSGDKSVKGSPKRKIPESHTLFEGYQFFLTASGGGDPASLGGVPGPMVPYDKDEYRELIELKGGKIIDTVGKERGKDKVLLISDNYARTVKYIYCLAASIPCVSHKWIQDCITQNKILPWKSYELNAGFNIEEEKVISPHKQKPLKGFGIYITAGSEDLYNYWKPVLMAAGANLLKPKKVKGKVQEDDIPEGTEVLVTDATCSPEILEKAHDRMISVVKPEWLVQSIIAGKKADFFSHEKYRVEMYEDEDDDEGEEEEDGDQ